MAAMRVVLWCNNSSCSSSLYYSSFFLLMNNASCPRFIVFCEIFSTHLSPD
jgi:hypothetical protein